MLKVDNLYKTISVNRGDENQSFSFSIPTSDLESYTFQIGDIVKFGIYEANKLNENAILLKEYKVAVETKKIEIYFNKEDLTIGELINKPVTYWYEIQLNGNTIIGYDEDGAKEFILYPEGSDIK